MLSPEEAWIWLLLLAGGAVFGLQGALMLAIRHRTGRWGARLSRCERVLHTPEAFLVHRPVADWAVGYYLLVLLTVGAALLQDAKWLAWLDGIVVVGVLATCYYAFLLFFRLRLMCSGCVRLYFTNLLIAVSLGGFHWAEHPEHFTFPFL
jgi:uncharacterized membrane protein